jgi:hypothetical protein
MEIPITKVIAEDEDNVGFVGGMGDRQAKRCEEYCDERFHGLKNTHSRAEKPTTE